MRWFIAASLLSLSFVTISTVGTWGDDSTDDSTVVATWEHRVTGKNGSVAKSIIKLYSNGKINDPKSKSTWSQKGATLTLRWPDPKAPGGAWQDTCTVSADGKTYSGRNQNGTTIAGTLQSRAVAADRKEPAPKSPSKTIADSSVKSPPKEIVEVASNEELPPVSPTKPPPADTVAAKAKLARAAYHKEVNNAANALLTAAQQKQDEINKNMPAEAKKPNSNGPNPFAPNGGQPVLNEFQKFYQGFGLPTGAAFEAAIADYWKAFDAAAKKLGAAGEEGLAAYEKLGVTDEAKLRPLRAMQLAGQHPEFLGIWTRSLGGSAREETFVIDFDEKSGGFQVEGLDADRVGTYGVIHGEKIEFKSGVLSFFATRVDRTNGALGEVSKHWDQAKGTFVKDGEVSIALTIKDGKLQSKTQSQGKTTTAVLERTQKFKNQRTLISYLKKGRLDGLEHNESALPTPNQVVEKLDLADVNAVWRCQAQLASFAYYGSKNTDPLPHEALYIPYRSSHLTVTPGAYGGLTDTLLGRGPGAAVNQDRTELLLSVYDKLAQAPHPFLKRTIAQELALCRTRLRLALADEQYGNTPASSVRQFQQTVVVPYVQYELQRDADRAELLSSLNREHPGYEIQLVGEVPLSEQSRQKLQQFAKGLGGMAEDVKNRALMSGLLAYADMAAADRMASLWQKRLLPLVRKSAGPESDKALVEIKADWREKKDKKGAFLRLSDFHLQNVSGQDMTSVVIELIAVNPWGEKAAHYYYVNQLAAGDFVKLLPNPRWEKRRLDFTNELTVTWSVWSDQGRTSDRLVRLTSPKPNPDVESTRTAYLRFDGQYQQEGEALGTIMQSMIPLPINAVSQRNLLLEAAAPGKAYVFRVGGEAKSGRTLVLRFRRFEARPGGVEAEVFDPANNQPLRMQTPIWKGQLDDNGVPAVIFGTAADWKESGWAFVIGPDDGLRIRCPAAGSKNAVFPTQDTPLFAVKLP